MSFANKLGATTKREEHNAMTMALTGQGGVGKTYLINPLCEFDNARTTLEQRIKQTIGATQYYYKLATKGEDTLGLYKIKNDGTITRNALNNNIELKYENKSYSIASIEEAIIGDIVIQDFGGQSKFAPIREGISRAGINAIIAVYALNEPSSIDNLVKNIKEVISNTPVKKTIPISLVGNKVDLYLNQNTVINNKKKYALETIEEVSNIEVVANIATSAKENKGIDEFVKGMGKLYIKAKE